ncbi:DUF6228 family protein [Nonomuraea sp. NPDC046802]|uniref:DUF6228 family protein n=1 Tax=Nonomuraea sp. NPDC046802 TaxID=3154919 RepID=UPI0033F39B59
MQVIIHSQKNPDVSVRLTNRRFAEEYETLFTIEARAEGLRAEVRDALASRWDREYLPDFIDGLASDFRGWAGRRTWHINHLALAATFHSGGHVALTWTLRPNDLFPDDSWETSTTTWLEAGEQLTAVAADIRAFFTRDDHPTRRNGHGSS